MGITSSTVRRIAGIGLAVAGMGIPIQIAGGADYPAVPPGLLILLAGAALLLTPWRWALWVGTLVAVFISFGAVATPNMREQLSAPGELLTFVGSAVQVVGLVTALAFCAAAIREQFSARSARRPERGKA